jgi:hypothetical protein
MNTSDPRPRKTTPPPAQAMASGPQERRPEARNRGAQPLIAGADQPESLAESPNCGSSGTRSPPSLVGGFYVRRRFAFQHSGYPLPEGLAPGRSSGCPSTGCSGLTGGVPERATAASADSVRMRARRLAARPRTADCTCRRSRRGLASTPFPCADAAARPCTASAFPGDFPRGPEGAD